MRRTTFSLTPRRRAKARRDQSTSAERQRERSLRSHVWWHGNELFTDAPSTRLWDRLAIVNATGDSFLKRVASLYEGLGLVRTGCETFGKIPERDDDLARAVGLKPCGIAELHLEPLRPRYSLALLKIRVLTLSLR